MNKTLKTFAACGLCMLMLVGCTQNANEPTGNTVGNTTTEEKDDTLSKYTDKYTDEANEIISSFADADAQEFVYANLGKDMSSYKFKDINGKDVTLANGEKTVVELIRYDCAACIASGETIKTTEKEFSNKGYRFIQIFINGESKDDIETYYKQAGISHFDTIVPYSDEVEDFLIDTQLSYVPAFLFIDENKKVSLGMVGYTFSKDDFQELADDYAFPKTKLYEMTKK